MPEPRSPQDPRPVLSIVVPLFNEEENVGAFHARVVAALERLGEPFEIVCVNDGSRDGTLERLVELHRRDPRVKVVNLSRNFGKEIALSAGLDLAGGDAVIPIDADLQDPPELIPEMVALWRTGWDVVYAQRTSRGGETALKRATSWLFYRVMRQLTRIDLPPDTGDFRLMDRRVVDALSELREQHRFMKGLFAWVGFRQIALPYAREPRHAGSTKWNYGKLFHFALEGITSFSFAPLQLASYAGALIALLSFLYGGYIVGRTLLQGRDVPGYPSLVAMILFLGGVQLVTLGVLGEYVGRIYAETKRRPLYLVRETLGVVPGRAPAVPPRETAGSAGAPGRAADGG
jgi:glycosyltransferase involved in cell wall biosynthesis